MSVYQYVPDVQTYDSLVLPKGKTYRRLEALQGGRAAGSWQAVSVSIYRVGRFGDFPYLTSHVPVFSDKALAALSPLLGDSIEALPLNCRSHQLFAIHVLELLDCLDQSRSLIERFDDGSIMDIERFVFKDDVVKGKHMFRIAQAPLKYVLISEEFKKAVEESGLRGLRFPKVG